MKKSEIFILSTLTLAIFTLPQKSFAVQEPRVLPTDPRIRTYVYDPNDVFKFLGHYKFQSSIEFSPEETISTISMGDSLAWQVSPSGNRLFIKPIEPDATTNMTVVTNLRIYQFELHAEEAEDVSDDSLTFSARFHYPSGSVGGSLQRFESEKGPDIEKEPEKYNFNYTISGSELISPLKIFDDGEFTYFEFRDKNADIPAFFNVDVDGNEAVINYHVAGKYVVVEMVAHQFTLRAGPDVACVFNESMPARKKKPEPKRKFLGIF